jgi:hypothetical protein
VFGEDPANWTIDQWFDGLANLWILEKLRSPASSVEAVEEAARENARRRLEKTKGKL